MAGIYATWYLFKYNHNTWMSRSSWRMIHGKEQILPGEPGYGVPVPDKAPSDYYDRGFKESILNKYKDKK